MENIRILMGPTVRDKLEVHSIGINFNLGQSGSEFEIIQTGSKSALRKSKPGDVRLVEQFKKHVLAQKQSLGALKTPTVLSEFENGGYLMELVHAVPLGQALNRMSLSQVEELWEKLEGYLSIILSKSASPDSSFGELLLSKITSLRAYALDQENLNFIQAVNLLTQHQELGLMKQGWNHGDFSYENILVTQDGKKSDVFIVDFLDSPFDSPLLDFGRFWLDLNYGWWGNKFAPNATWSINNKLLRENFTNLLVKLRISQAAVSYFTLFASLRILPYTKNPVRIAHLKSSIADIVKRSEEWQY